MKTGASRVSFWSAILASVEVTKHVTPHSLGIGRSHGAHWRGLRGRPSLRAPPPVFLPPPPSWTGLYVGINAGYTWSANNSVNTAAILGSCNPLFLVCSATPNFSVTSASLATFSAPANTNGFIGGGQIGYNYQFNNSFVAGIEVDIQGVAGAHGSSSIESSLGNPNFPISPFDQSASVSRSLDYLGTVRGRLGFLITPALLVYGTGGLAYGQTSSSTSISQFVENAGSSVQPNPFLLSAAFPIRASLDRWRRRRMVVCAQLGVKVEYLYYDIRNTTYSLSSLVGIGGPGSAVIGSVFTPPFRNPQLVSRAYRSRRLELSIQLVGSGPVVAKY